MGENHRSVVADQCVIGVYESEMEVRRCGVGVWEGGRLVDDYGGRIGVHQRQGARDLLEKDRRRNAIDGAL
ncbi:hypothetical protein U1Q18_028119, partial [Sarracenia purpurea var. burkii]